VTGRVVLPGDSIKSGMIKDQGIFYEGDLYRSNSLLLHTRQWLVPAEIYTEHDGKSDAIEMVVCAIDTVPEPPFCAFDSYQIIGNGGS
jgi:hypothetical protein